MTTVPQVNNVALEVAQPLTPASPQVNNVALEVAQSLTRVSPQVNNVALEVAFPIVASTSSPQIANLCAVT